MNCRPETAPLPVPGRPTPLAPRITHHVSRFTFHSSHPTPHARRSQTAFSLLEVMIACGIFFMAIFAILSLVSSTLRNARALRRVEVDAGMVAAKVCNTNKLYEGVVSGDFADDLGNNYSDYFWETYTTEAATNHLFQVDIVVRRRGLQQPVDKMSIFVYAPDSPTAGFGRPTLR